MSKAVAEDVSYSTLSSTEPDNRLAKAMVGVSVVTLCAKLFGFGEKVVIAHYFGAGATADIYFGVMGLMWAIVFLVKELLHPTLLPVFSRTLVSERLSTALFRRVFLLTGAIMLFIGAGLAMTAPVFIDIMLSGFSQEQQRVASALFRGILPGTTCLVLMVVTYTCLNARKRFVVSAIGEAALKFIIVVGLLCLTPLLNIYAIGPVLGFAGVVCLLLHLGYLPERVGIVKLRFGTDVTQESKAIIRLMLPMSLGIIFSNVSGLVDNNLASGLPAGHLSSLSYAKKTLDAILVAGPVAFVTVVYGHLAHLYFDQRRKEASELISSANRIMLFVSVPLTCILIETRLPVVRVLFQRGNFDFDSALITSRALLVYSCGFTVFTLEALFVYSFYAAANTRTPVIWGIVFVAVDIILAIILVRLYGYLGIAGAYVISKGGKVFVLGLLLRRGMKSLWGPGSHIFFVKLGISTAALWAGIKLPMYFINQGHRDFSIFIDLAVPVLTGAACFACLSHVLKMKETSIIASMLRRVASRFAR